ncbi:MAG: FlgD immunoglobulin-like domain containing protein [Candidatus Stygibacter australis]|nr:FlgD immunoglobulin-like domain containing protein [Candidatus Stygibacter australis]
MQNKKFLIAFVITLFIPVICLAYFWSEIGPADIETYNFYVFGGGVAYEIICEENGILVNEGDEWIEYSYYDLPVWDVETVMAATADIIAVMGDGSYSDGIYGFNFINHEFNILHWMLNPRFITYCPADTSYYAGGEDGLYSSHDGFNWENVSFFDNIQCLDMEAYQEHYVVSTSGNIYYSSDAGNSWNESNTMQNLSDLVVSPSGTFYGIFPDQSWSSGLYSSGDYGMNWEVEFWSVNMSSAGFDENDNLFVGWEVPQTMEQGIACWYEDISELEYMNEGLPCFQINQISWHPQIDCINIIACTDSGLYLLTDYLTEIEPDLITNIEIATSNYPNPFNPETTISFTLPYSTVISLDIYNAKGEKVRRLFRGFLSSGENYQLWNGTNDQGDQLPSGIYHYKITAGQLEEFGKMILLK